MGAVGAVEAVGAVVVVPHRSEEDERVFLHLIQLKRTLGEEESALAPTECEQPAGLLLVVDIPYVAQDFTPTVLLDPMRRAAM